MTNIRALTIVAAVAATYFVQQRAVSTTTLSGNGTELPQEFTNVQTVRELRDGRVVVADPCEKGIFILDFERRTSTKIGREGQGPGEYQLPLIALGSAGDESLVLDIGGQKFLSVTSTGDVRAVASPEDRTAVTRQLGFSFSSRVLTDTLGRIYANGNHSSREEGKPRQIYDSVAITRFDPRTALLDTVAYFSTKQEGGQGSGTTGAGGRSASPTPSGPDIRSPFRATDTWVVAPDGSVGIVRPVPFTIEWVSPQKKHALPRPLSHVPIRVTDAEKNEEMNPVVQAHGCTMRVTRQVQGALIGTMTMTVPGGFPQGNPTYSWPEFKHPFEASDEAVVATSDGGVMILMQRAARDSIPTYNIYDREGTLVRRLQLPPRTQFMGAGRGTVYVARHDQDGLQYLRRYRIPG